MYQGGSADGGLVVCLLHGAGYSALTWSLLSHHLAHLVDCRLVALDLRGHGESQVEVASGGELDMSGEVMARDVTEVLTSLYGGEDVGVVLVGHSMGGALAALVAERQETLPLYTPHATIQTWLCWWRRDRKC